MADTGSPVAVPAFKKRTNKAAQRKRPATPPPQTSSDSDSASSASDNEGHDRVKRRKREGLAAGTTSTSKLQTPAADLSKATKFAADRSANISQTNDATRASTWYTDAALGSDSQPTDKNVDEMPDGTYKGASSGYGSFIQKHPNATQSGGKHVGPVKAPTNVRAITVTDFAPDVCKDYKQTGFCGFGDSCKFLHAREDYKQGWQLDKEWERAGKDGNTTNAKPDGDEGLDDEEKMLKDIPFKCVICKGDYKMPVVTKCGHYFCEKCAMTRYMKEKRKGCAVCGKDTGGSFGVARKLKELLQKKREREEERAEKEGEGEDAK